MAGGSTRRAVLGARIATLVFAVGLVGALVALPNHDRGAPSADTCLGSTSPAALSTIFADEPGGVIAADYQRAVPLPDGRTLWLFQDATVRLPEPDPDPADPPAPTERLLHNIGMIQNGTCFTVLHSGTDDDPQSWILPGPTVPFSHWFWPLGAEMGNDGDLYIYVAEMVERGGLYLSASEPIGTRIVAIDLATMSLAGAWTPPGSSPQLYGFSVTSDSSWTYLYGHCHRQFGWDIGPFGVPAHDLGCSGNVPVARVPKGQMLDPLAYWDGLTWQSDPNRAVSVMPTGRTINPSQVQWIDGEFLAVTKVGDWFGTTIYLDRAPNARGPWKNYARIPAPQRCEPNTRNSYFASWIPSTAISGGTNGDFVIGLSHNRWDGAVTAINRPTYLLAPPPGSHAFALRCSIVDC